MLLCGQYFFKCEIFVFIILLDDNEDTFAAALLRRISIRRMWVELLNDKVCEHVQYQLFHKTASFYLIRATEKKFN